MKFFINNLPFVNGLYLPNIQLVPELQAEKYQIKNLISILQRHDISYYISDVTHYLQIPLVPIEKGIAEQDFKNLDKKDTCTEYESHNWIYSEPDAEGLLYDICHYRYCKDCHATEQLHEWSDIWIDYQSSN